MKNFNIKSKALSMLVLLLVLLCSAGYSQSGTFGNTYIGNGAEMAIHNVQQNFLNGGSGVLPGIVGTQRTASTGYLSFVGTATSLGAADNAHVDGYAKTYMTAAFTFPIGDNGKYRPAAVSTATLANPANAAYFGVSGTTAITSSISGGNEPVLPSSGPFATTSKDATVNTVDNVEYWDINGATAANITLTWDANSAVASMTSNQLALLKILGWNGTQWVIVPSTYDATSILGGASTLTSGSITTTSTLTPNSYEVYTLGSLKFVTNPDVNQGVINKPIPGNVATNDVAPAGTTYGTPVLGSSPAGSSPTMTMNPDGTYTFQSDKPGVYVYNVPVCVPGQVAPCPTQPLVITVQDPALANNTPVANTDITSTAFNTPVTYPVKANDAAVNPGNTLGNPTITAAPTHGTAVVNGDGTITYTPTVGYVGNDTLTYQVCETPSGICKTAQMIVTVNPSSPVNSTTAADDYNVTTGTAPATGNVKTNDTDPNGNTQTVTPQNITVPGKGTFVLLADGSYTFTPVAGFSGTVDLPYTTCDNGTPQACATATLHIVVKPAPVALKPDVNEGVVNKPIPGSVASNDVAPAGTTYGTPVLGSSPAGSSPTMTMNPDGTYTFQSDKPGVYVYNVPVCVPGQVAPCPTQPLVITVQDPAVANNTPVANTDVTSTGFNTPVTYPVKANDAAVNPGNTLGNPTITAAPTHGTAVVNGDGTITYTPTAGYVGNDTLTYQVCETPSGICKTAQMIVTVNPSSPVNSTTAADDYNSTTGTTPATGNVKTNDTDPNGNTQTLTPQNITVPGKGTFVLLADGSYTFTPVAGFSGTVDLPYTTCDNGTPQACATATLHIVVKPAPVALNPDVNAGVVNKPIPGSVATNDVVPAGTTYGTPVLGSSPAGSTPTMTMNPDGTYTFQSDKPGVYVYNVPVCVPGQVAPCPTQPLTITVQDPALLTNVPVANPDVTSTAFNTPVTYPVKANDAAVNPGNTLGNPTITAAPTHGTAVVNGDGTITYTPTAGYVGNDTLTYQVCETPSGICTTAKMIVTVNPTNPVNSTTAADDYNSTAGTVPATGSVKTNDTDPNGNTQTVTPQNITVPGKGTFVLLADGTYTFTPQSGFAGTVDLPYTTCDNGTPQACATATLHIVVKSVTVVPIKLLSFVANPKGNTVQLTWVVTTEINVANYEIEYSATGANFTSIGAVTATGSSNYSLVHYAPKQGLNYYRLKIIDKDGKVSYSEVRKVNFGVIEGMVSVYPVPARDVINITLTGNLINQSATIVLFSMDGKLMLKQVTPALSQTETINVSKFASGQYILQIITTTEVVNKKIEIVK